MIFLLNYSHFYRVGKYLVYCNDKGSIYGFDSKMSHFVFKTYILQQWKLKLARHILLVALERVLATNQICYSLYYSVDDDF